VLHLIHKIFQNPHQGEPVAVVVHRGLAEAKHVFAHIKAENEFLLKGVAKDAFLQKIEAFEKKLAPLIQGARSIQKLKGRDTELDADLVNRAGTLKNLVDALYQEILVDEHLSPESKTIMFSQIKAFERIFVDSATPRYRELTNGNTSPAVSSTSPIDLAVHYYRSAETSIQKRAFLCYLLQYQHYNADFSESDRTALGYPTPFSDSSSKATYIRSSELLFKLANHWINDFLSDFFKRSYPGKTLELSEKIIQIGSSLAIDVIKTFCSENIELHDIDSLFAKQFEEKSAKLQVFIVKITSEDLKKTAFQIQEEQLNLVRREFLQKEMRGLYPDLRFLFVLESNDKNANLMWLTSGDKGGPISAWDKSDLITPPAKGQATFADKLNEAGAISDRIALNTFMAEQLGRTGSPQEDLAKIGINTAPESFSTESAHSNWLQKINDSLYFDLEKNHGSSLYRDAILRWHAQFFKKYDLLIFAAPLLCQQVLPWMGEEGEVRGWSKAYQNVCEISMLCIQAFPEKFSDISLESTVLSALDPQTEFSKLHTMVGLYPYAMSTIFNILHQVLNRPQFNTKESPPKIVHTAQQYFETTEVLNQLKAEGKISVEGEHGLLHQIPHNADILITDIHPNNATRKTSAQNDVATWIEDHFRNAPKDKKLIVILDLTLNHLSDPVVQGILKKGAPYINDGQLEIFLLQSLAKLMQLGADNFSGGLCIYLGNPNAIVDHPAFPPAIPAKSSFFALFNQYLQDIATDYFKYVRKNTGLMYGLLDKGFQEIEQHLSINDAPFCASKVAYSSDDSTAYVVINFSPFLDLKIFKKNRKPNSANLQEIIQTLAYKYKSGALAKITALSLTSRQSFGFSLTSMAAAPSAAIRFSVGIENKEQLENYAFLITAFSHALSTYAVFLAKSNGIFDLKSFSTKMIKAFDQLEKGADKIKIPMHEFIETFSGRPRERKGTAFAGSASISVVNKQPIVASYTLESDKEIHANQSAKIKPYIVSKAKDPKSTSKFIETKWSDYNLIQLLFSAQLEEESQSEIPLIGLTKMSKTYSIQGIFKKEISFYEEKDTSADESSGITLTRTPFSLSHNGREYRDNEIFVMPSFLELDETHPRGILPLMVSRLNEQETAQVYARCTRHDLGISPRGDGVLIILKSRKPLLNYTEQLLSLCKNNLKEAVAWLNTLDLNELPLADGPAFENTSPGEPVETIREALVKLGSRFIYDFNDEMLNDIKNIRYDDWKIAFIEGLIKALFDIDPNSFSNEINEGKATSISNALALNLHDLEIELFYDALDHQIQVLLTKMDQGTHLLFLKNYLTAIFPLIQRIYRSPLDLTNTLQSAALAKLADKAVEFPELKNHINQLIVDLLIKAETAPPEHFNYYLELYAKYPLTDQNKEDLLAALNKIDKASHKKWLFNDNINYESDDEELKFTREDQPAILEFLKKTGSRAHLLDLLAGIARIDPASEDYDLDIFIADEANVYDIGRNPTPEILFRSLILRWSRLTNDDLLCQLVNLQCDDPNEWLNTAGAFLTQEAVQRS